MDPLFQEDVLLGNARFHGRLLIHVPGKRGMYQHPC